MTEIENNRILSPRTNTQNIKDTIISVYGPQDNELFEEKNKVLWLCACENTNDLHKELICASSSWL